MARNTQHVVPNSEGTWSVKRDGATKATKKFGSKATAINFGRAIAINQRAELIIHNKDGTINNTNSFGHDPHPPVDKRR